MRNRLNLLVVASLFTIGALGAEAPSAGIPNDVAEANQKASKWVNSLKGKSDARIVAELGNPTERLTWEFEGQKELRFRYSLATSKGTLELYFVRDHVITVSLQLLSS